MKRFLITIIFTVTGLSAFGVGSPDRIFRDFSEPAGPVRNERITLDKFNGQINERYPDQIRTYNRQGALVRVEYINDSAPLGCRDYFYENNQLVEIQVDPNGEGSDYKYPYSILYEYSDGLLISERIRYNPADREHEFLYLSKLESVNLFLAGIIQERRNSYDESGRLSSIEYTYDHPFDEPLGWSSVSQYYYHPDNGRLESVFLYYRDPEEAFRRIVSCYEDGGDLYDSGYREFEDYQLMIVLSAGDPGTPVNYLDFMIREYNDYYMMIVYRPTVSCIMVMDNGRLAEEWRFLLDLNHSGRGPWARQHCFDDQGREIRQVSYHYDDETDEFFTVIFDIEYSGFDEYGNWAVQTVTRTGRDGDITLFSRIERTLAYY
jgi:hypothetical protein